MLEQLKILNPKLIITLGEFPTKNLLNFKFDKFSDVVGNIYEVNGYKILPIYHPSPISPMSYKGNVPIFENLRDMQYYLIYIFKFEGIVQTLMSAALVFFRYEDKMKKKIVM